jgi:hypothetical protein
MQCMQTWTCSFVATPIPCGLTIVRANCGLRCCVFQKRLALNYLIPKRSERTLGALWSCDYVWWGLTRLCRQWLGGVFYFDLNDAPMASSCGADGVASHVERCALSQDGEAVETAKRPTSSLLKLPRELRDQVSPQMSNCSAKRSQLPDIRLRPNHPRQSRRTLSPHRTPPPETLHAHGHHYPPRPPPRTTPSEPPSSPRSSRSPAKAAHTIPQLRPLCPQNTSVPH